MEELILYGADRKKKAVIKNCIDFDCSIGRKAYSENDFVLKTPFDKDNLLEIGEWVVYGQTEYGGVIRRRTIDTQAQTVIYEGVTFRGVLNYIANKTISNNATSLTGTMDDIMNEMLTLPLMNNGLRDVYVAESDDETEYTVSLLTTTGFYLVPVLSHHDNIIRQCSTGSTPKKSKFYFKDGVIHIKFSDSQTFYYDSTHAFVKYSEATNVANACWVNIRRSPDNPNGAFAGALMLNDGTISGDLAEWENWIVFSGQPTDDISIITERTGTGYAPTEATGYLADAQEKPSVELTVDTEEAELDDVIVASISELQMKVTKKVVESSLKISNDIAKITYTLEG